jgi:hypothetical protein
MAVIKVPRPPASAFDLDRPVSTLLKNQIRHLQEAEFRLPASMQTNTYINAIKTEGQAADYIRRVTQALHHAHAIGPEIGARPVTKTAARARRTTGRDLAAAAATPRKSKGKRGGSTKKRTGKNRN